MGISGINDFYGALSSYRVPNIPSVSVSEVEKQDKLKTQNVSENAASASSSSLQDISLPSVKRSNADVEDISLTFNKGDDYGYIGKDSDIYSLDVQNAISDMQKDDVLRQYQYFVGGNSSFGDPSDGVVIPKL